MCKTNSFLPVIVFFAMILMAASCKKKDSPAPANNNNNTNTSPYYFRLTLNGGTDTVYDYQRFGYTTNSNAIYGDVTQSLNSPVPYVSLWLGTSSNYDTLTESDVLGLTGKTLYFGGSSLAPEIEYQPTLSDSMWRSDDSQDSSYNIKISNVTFLDTTRFEGLPARRYVIAGTCKTRMYLDGAITYIDTTMTGSFNMIIARIVYK